MGRRFPGVNSQADGFHATYCICCMRIAPGSGCCGAGRCDLPEDLIDLVIAAAAAAKEPPVAGTSVVAPQAWEGVPAAPSGSAAR